MGSPPRLFLAVTRASCRSDGSCLAGGSRSRQLSPLLTMPQSDGQTGRVHQALQHKLRTYIQTDEAAWGQLLPPLELAHSCTTSSTTLLSPFEVKIGERSMTAQDLDLLEQLKPLTAPPQSPSFSRSCWIERLRTSFALKRSRRSMQIVSADPSRMHRGVKSGRRRFISRLQVILTSVLTIRAPSRSWSVLDKMPTVWTLLLLCRSMRCSMSSHSSRMSLGTCCSSLLMAGHGQWRARRTDHQSSRSSTFWTTVGRAPPQNT